MEFASKGVGAAGLTTGIIGAALGAANSGIVGNVLGGRSVCPEDHPVTRYDAEKDATIARLETQNKLLEANIYTDQKIADVYERLSGKIACLEAQTNQQAVYNAANNATINCISGQVAQLMALTKLVIPNGSICPGWGNVTVAPAAAATT